MSANAPDPSATPPAPAPDVAGLQKELESLRKHAEKLKGEKNATAAKVQELEQRFAKLGEVVGFDPTKTDPETVKAQREAEARATQEKAARVREAVLMAAVATGKKLPKEVVRMVVREAVDHPSIKLTETGDVEGAEAFLETISAFIATPSEAPGAPPTAPALPRPNGQMAGPDPKFGNVKTLADLKAMGPASFNEFATRYPDRLKGLMAGRP